MSQHSAPTQGGNTVDDHVKSGVVIRRHARSSRVPEPLLRNDLLFGPDGFKRLGAGSKMRHIELAALCVQELVRQEPVKVAEFSGELNPANCLTKHLGATPKEQCMSDLGMADMSKSDLRT